MLEPSPTSRINDAAVPLNLRSAADYRLAFRLIDTAYPGIAEHEVEAPRKEIFRHLDCLRAVYPEFTDLQGLRILDVACGSRLAESNNHRRFDPWMARLLTALGAHVVGVDIAEQRNETFESHQADLTDPDALAIFKSGSFDACYLGAFPTLRAIRSYEARGMDWPTFKTSINRDLELCPKPGGRIIRTFTDKTDEFVEKAKGLRLIGVDDNDL